MDGEVIRLDHRIASLGDLLDQPSLGVPRAKDPQLATSDLTWLPPLDDHNKIFCVGFNYAAHASESRREVTGRPTLFIRFPDSFVGAGASVIRPADSDTLDWEGEVAAIIGRHGRRIAADSACDYIAGYTCIAENSVREWQGHSRQATAGKNWASSGAIGPWIVSRDEAGDGPFELSTRLNGEVVQQDSTEHLVFSVAELVAYISTFTPVRPGDVIATGTPQGIGYRMDPPRFLRPGDTVEVDVLGIATLWHDVVDEVTDLNAGLA
jgi:2-keto-4-pentenoate hydratase/2-oxohepta-3-ene-1,7-dioic acid hydratase in catechol pathway